VIALNGVKNRVKDWGIADSDRSETLATRGRHLRPRSAAGGVIRSGGPESALGRRVRGDRRLKVSGLTTKTAVRRSRNLTESPGEGREQPSVEGADAGLACAARRPADARAGSLPRARRGGPGLRARGLAETAGGRQQQIRRYDGSGKAGGVRRRAPFPAGRLYWGGQSAIRGHLFCVVTVRPATSFGAGSGGAVSHA
jgi:hypothetical protein